MSQQQQQQQQHQSSSQAPSRQPASRNGIAGSNPVTLPPEIMDIVYPGLKVGAAAGGVGMFVGAIGGIMTNAPPVLFSLFSGVQWFTLGSSYTIYRRMLISTWGAEESLTKSDKVKISTLAGCSAGFTGALLRGPKNLVPGAIVFSMLGAGGQYAYNAFAKEGSQLKQKEKKSWLDSKWSPLTPLTDEHYVSILEEKILRIDAEIAIIDDNLAGIRAAQKKEQEEAAKKPPTPAPTENKS